MLLDETRWFRPVPRPPAWVTEHRQQQSRWASQNFVLEERHDREEENRNAHREQAAMLPKIAEEWIATGLSTEPATGQQQRKGYASRTARRSSSHHRS